MSSGPRHPQGTTCGARRRRDWRTEGQWVLPRPPPGRGTHHTLLPTTTLTLKALSTLPQAGDPPEVWGRPGRLAVSPKPHTRVDQRGLGVGVVEARAGCRESGKQRDG